MPTISQGIIDIKEHDKDFAGTIAFRNEKLTLPDGSKIAIGIDGERWVVLFQKTPPDPFIMYEYNALTKTLLVDKKPGKSEDYKTMTKMVAYFFSHAESDDVVTIEVGENNNKK